MTHEQLLRKNEYDTIYKVIYSHIVIQMNRGVNKIEQKNEQTYVFKRFLNGDLSGWM